MHLYADDTTVLLRKLSSLGSKSLVLYFPPSVYQKIGAAEMLPQLLEILKPDDLRCVQFFCGERVRVSFSEKTVRDRRLAEGLCFGDEDIPVTRDAQKLTKVYIRDLPYEFTSDDLLDFFGTFCEVLTVERSVSPDFPSLCTGNHNRIVKIVLEESVPYFMTIFDFECRVWYREQPSQCSVCGDFGHRAQSCPCSGLCRRCRRPGHKVRECTQAWDPVFPFVSADVDPFPVDDSNMSESATIIEDVEPPVDLVPELT